jgi:DUF917 family protein
VEVGGVKLRILSSRDLLDLKDGAAIFSAGGGGSPEAGEMIVQGLVASGYEVALVAPSEVPRDARVVNFACVGATAAVSYEPNAATRTLRALEKAGGFSAYAIIPVELGGFNTLAAVDVAARCGVPVVDGDGAGRSVPEVHLKVYTLDGIPLTPMAVSDAYAQNMVIVEAAVDSEACERIARLLATEWNGSAYTARRILTGTQVRTSPIQHSLTKAMRIGRRLRLSPNPIEATVEETGAIKLFEGTVDDVHRETRSGFTLVDVEIRGADRDAGKKLLLKAKNEVLAAYEDGRILALAPDIITPVDSRTGRCITAEGVEKKDDVVVLGLPAPRKWMSPRGLALWRDTLQRAGITETYSPVANLARA